MIRLEKIKVVNEVADALKLKNVRAQQIRCEEVTEKFDFVVSRAVADLSEMYGWVRNKFHKNNNIVYIMV